METLKSDFAESTCCSHPTRPSYSPGMAFINRLRRAGQVIAVSVSHCYTTVETLMWRFAHLSFSAMVDAMISVANHLYRCGGPFVAALPLVHPFIISDFDSLKMERAAMIVDELAIPLESDRERAAGQSGTLEQLITRIGIAVKRLAAFTCEPGSESRAQREASYLQSFDRYAPGLAALFHLYDNRAGEGIYESALLATAANVGERLALNRSGAGYLRDIHTLILLWEAVICARETQPDRRRPGV